MHNHYLLQTKKYPFPFLMWCIQTTPMLQSQMKQGQQCSPNIPCAPLHFPAPLHLGDAIWLVLANGLRREVRQSLLSQSIKEQVWVLYKLSSIMTTPDGGASLSLDNRVTMWSRACPPHPPDSTLDRWCEWEISLCCVIPLRFQS